MKVSNPPRITRRSAFVGNHLVYPPAVAGDRTRIAAATTGDRTLEIAWADGHRSRFHYLWLRFNCFCAICGDTRDGIRFIQMTDVAPDIAPQSMRQDEAGDIELVWPDGHRSLYGPDWLRAYCYSAEERARRRSFRPRLWKSELLQNMPRAHFPELASRRKQLDLMRQLRDFGIVLVDDVGPDPEKTKELSAIFGPIRETSSYGTIYDVQAEPVSMVGAKTAVHQNPHQDDAFQYSMPGLNVFHFISNTRNGGESTYVDGFAVAESLRAEEPRAFELLSTVPVQFHRRHPDALDLRASGPVIRLNHDGRLAGVRYFDRTVAPLDAPEDLVEPMFAAQRAFLERVTSPDFRIEFSIEPGTAVVLDNQRVFHGRNAFDSSAPRRVRLCQVDRDEFHGRLRQLAQEFGDDDYDLMLPSGAAAD